MNPYESHLNGLAQGFISMSEALTWYDGHSDSSKTELLLVLAFYVKQCRPTYQETCQAVTQSGLPKNDALSRRFRAMRDPQTQLSLLIEKSMSESRAVFEVLSHLFVISDSRRRAQCRLVGCAHYWHHPVR